MTHVELSLTDPTAPRLRPATVAYSGLERWASVVAEAGEPCLVVDADGVVVAVSLSAAGLTGIADPLAARGLRLRDAMAPLLDFSAAAAPLEQFEADRIPPLLAVSSGLMARGLIRVATRPGGTPVTLDAIATPLSEGPAVIGSLTFLAAI